MVIPTRNTLWCACSGLWRLRCTVNINCATGNERMEEIASAIQEGQLPFLIDNTPPYP